MVRYCMLEQITPVILTYNEQPNIGRVLERLTWANVVIVVDSYSTDETVDIASGFSNVRIVQHAFVSHAAQWNFAIHKTGITTEWVLALDADYVLTSAFIDELRILEPERNICGYRASFQYCIFGRPLRGTLYPPVTALYRREGANYFQDGHTQRIKIVGKIENLQNKIFHDDRKSLSAWLHAQNRYMNLEAQVIAGSSMAELGIADKIRKGIVVAPACVFLYCLLVRGCVLDGWPGVYYALQRTVAEMILSLKLMKVIIEK